MKILTFHSYKGGVGKTSALLNIAYILSNKYKKKIGLIDFDVEAAGLHCILDIEVRPRAELLNFILPQNRDVANLENYVYKVKIMGNEIPTMYIIPSLGDPKILSRLTWDLSAFHFLQTEVFPKFGKMYDLDYLLIDSRTGLSEFSSFALTQSDLTLLLCRLDKQNSFGIEKLVSIYRASGKDFLVIVNACPKIRSYKKKIVNFEKNIKTKVDCILPYLGELYFEECLVAKKSPNTALAKQYYSLTKQLVEKLK